MQRNSSLCTQRYGAVKDDQCELLPNADSSSPWHTLTHTYTTKDTNGEAEPHRTACQAKIWEHIFDLAEQSSDPGVHSGAGLCPSSICPSFCIVGQQRAVDEVSQIEMNLYSSGTAACKTQLLFFHPFSGEQHVLETVAQRLRCWQPSFS